MARHGDPDKIAKAMASLDIHDYGDVLQCMRCGTCIPTCPTYRTEGIETQSPRGRVAMIKAVIDGRLPASDEFVEHHVPLPRLPELPERLSRGSEGRRAGIGG